MIDTSIVAVIAIVALAAVALIQAWRPHIHVSGGSAANVGGENNTATALPTGTKAALDDTAALLAALDDDLRYNLELIDSAAAGNWNGDDAEFAQQLTGAVTGARAWIADIQWIVEQARKRAYSPATTEREVQENGRHSMN
jgi:hypothetical protein